jgi:hypothetical protein
LRLCPRSGRYEFICAYIKALYIKALYIKALYIKALEARRPLRLCQRRGRYKFAQFTCLASTEVQILTLRARRRSGWMS